MAITTRAGKGSPLTHTEVDTNFTDLRDNKAGYVTGDGGEVQQQDTNGKATGVTLNKLCGIIQMDDATLAAGDSVSFILSNNKVTANDVIAVNHIDVGSGAAYLLNAQASANQIQFFVRNITTSDKSQGIKLAFAVIKSVNS